MSVHHPTKLTDESITKKKTLPSGERNARNKCCQNKHQEKHDCSLQNTPMVKGHENYVSPKKAFDRQNYGIKKTTTKPPPPGFPPLEKNAGNKCCQNKHQEKHDCSLQNTPMVKGHENYVSPKEAFDSHYCGIKKTTTKPPPPGFPPLEKNAGNKCCQNKHQEKHNCSLQNTPMVKGHENYVPPKEAFDSHYYGIKITTIKPPPPGFPPLERNAGNKCCHNKHQEKRYCHLHNRPMVKVPENNSSHGEVGNCNYLEQYLEKTGQRVPPTTKVIYHDHHLHSPKSSPLPLSPPPPSVSNSSHTCTHDYQRIVKAQKAKADNKTPEDIEAENPLCAEVRRIGDLFFNRVRKEDEKYICESTVALLKGTKQYICLCYQNYLSNHGKSTIARKLESPRERKQRPSFVHYSGRLARMFRKDDGEIRAYSVISISSNKLNNPTHKLCGKNVCQNCSHQH